MCIYACNSVSDRLTLDNSNDEMLAFRIITKSLCDETPTLTLLVFLDPNAKLFSDPLGKFSVCNLPLSYTANESFPHNGKLLRVH